MKATATIIALVGLVVPAVMAQFPADFPACGTDCVTRMLGQAASLGCPGAPDAKCLCQNKNFLYGVRDCSYQSCHNDTAAGITVQYGLQYCKDAGIVVPIETTPGNDGAGATATATAGAGGGAGATGTGTGAGAGGGAGSSVPVTTSAIVSTISSGGSVVTSTVGSTTLFSVIGGGAGGNGNGGSVAISTSSFSTVITTGGSTITSSGASTIFGSASVTTSAIVSTIVSGGSTRVTTAGSTVITSTSRPTTTSTSSGLAPQKTAAPAGLLAVAGLAALLL